MFFNFLHKKIGGRFLIISVLLLTIFGYLPKSAVAAGASFYFSPNTGTFFVGSTFDVSVFVNTGGNNINAVRVDLKFDPKKIQIASPTTGKSFISVWIAQPIYSNVEGRASFQGGIPDPGINTSAGLVSTITFRAIAPGETVIYFSDSSKILLNDGMGTNILSSMDRGVYGLTIPPPEGPRVYSSTHPDQNKWYRNSAPAFSWEKEEGVTDFSYTVNNDVSAVPDNISEGDNTSISYADLKDGIWYFHVKAKKGNSWGGVSNYVVQLDATPPADFTIGFDPKLKKSPVITSRDPIISFITTDALSGLDHYELKTIDFNALQKGETGFFTEVSSPYKLPTLNTGEHEVIVRAFDVAGNWRDKSTRIEVIPTEKIIYITRNGVNIWIFFLSWRDIMLFIIILIILILAIVFFHWRRNKKLNEKRENLANIKKDAEKNTWLKF
jgi:hypothetical protein